MTERSAAAEKARRAVRLLGIPYMVLTGLVVFVPIERANYGYWVVIRWVWLGSILIALGVYAVRRREGRE